ncbi:MAG: hypothetical protein E6G68_06165 [Actinobacteria bacterium]|nr:MAG: hypothetical protein E6G68_06165 [Actinomycetota bacterium]
MTTTKRILATALLGLVIAGLAIPAATAAAPATTLNYSVRDARAFLWQVAYPQSTFISEKYFPCDPTTDHYGCDRGRYAKSDRSTCDAPLGRTGEAPETPTAAEAADGVGPTDADGTASSWPRGNPVEVIHGLAMGRLGSSPESGGLASMYYVDQSGRRETEAHVESDGYVSNRNDYEERCAKVDAILESTYMNEPFAAHMLSRADQTPSTYSMSSFTTSEASAYPPGQPKEDVSIVKLWQAGGRVHGLLTSTVRAFRLADQITVDLVRSVISFSSDGTPSGLIARAKTEALGVTIGTTKLPALEAPSVIPLGDDSYLGVLSPVVQVGGHGTQITIRAPGLFLAAKTPLDQLPVPEDPLDMDPIPSQFRGQLTLGGHLFSEQVVYIAGAYLDAGVGRIESFGFPPIPLPKPIAIPPVVAPPPLPPSILPPPPFVPPVTQPVALPRYVTRELPGSAWTMIAIVVFTILGLLGVMGKWSQRFPWGRALAEFPPLAGVGWAYRAFLKG